VQRGLAQFGQCGTGGVAQQARGDDIQGESVITLADEGGGGMDERRFRSYSSTTPAGMSPSRC